MKKIILVFLALAFLTFSCDNKEDSAPEPETGQYLYEDDVLTISIQVNIAGSNGIAMVILS